MNLIIPNRDDHIRMWIYESCKANNVPQLFKKISYRFNNKLTRCFGLAYTNQKHVEFSSPLWDRATEQEKRQVVIHETCHIIAKYKHDFKIKDHGEEWKKCMIAVGVAPERCHTVDREGLVRQYVKYEADCGCTKIWVGHVKAGQVRNKNLSCRKCKGKVSLTGQTFKPKSDKLEQKSS